MSLLDLFAPKVAYASFDEFLGKVNGEIINPLILFLFALAVVFFLWGMLEFILNQQSEEAKTTGKSHMVWGVVGIAIMLGVWTILNIVLNTLNIPKSEIDPEAGEVHLGP
ncbi:MAG TPA: hypothetical protein VJL32_02070 [Candidatus Paceibacterota bacterium]